MIECYPYLSSMVGQDLTRTSLLFTRHYSSHSSPPCLWPPATALCLLLQWLDCFWVVSKACLTTGSIKKPLGELIAGTCHSSLPEIGESPTTYRTIFSQVPNVPEKTWLKYNLKKTFFFRLIERLRNLCMGANVKPPALGREEHPTESLFPTVLSPHLRASHRLLRLWYSHRPHLPWQTNNAWREPATFGRVGIDPHGSDKLLRGLQ